MKIKNFLYKYSIILFIGFVSFLIVSFPFQYTQDKMNNVSQPVRWLGALLFFLICFFIIKCKEQIGKILEKLICDHVSSDRIVTVVYNLCI